MDPKWLLLGLSDTQIEGIFTVSWRVIIVGHIAWACGWLAYLGVGGGFARAEDFSKNTSEIRALKVEFLEQQIWEAQMKECEALIGLRDSSAYSFRLSQLLDKYQEATGRLYPLRTCFKQ